MPDTLIESIEDLRFDNRFTRSLPADPETENAIRQVLGACFSRVQPQAVAGPQRVAHAGEVAARLGMSEAACLRPEFAEVLTGNRVLDGMDPHAMCYGGHQFGHWAGQLGDGRAINLGEVLDVDGQHQMLQLKGAGPTPYSRHADGLAVLRSSVREFLCSEAMHHLGVPTTRALSLCLTGEQVLRDMFYDGRAAMEPGAVVCRVAPSFLRFGNYEILAASGQHELLKTLVDFTIRTLFPHLLPQQGEPDKEVYVAWFAEVARRTAEMVVHWQRVGFVHGVMNTDNMSILGLTIDYGPYGWLEDYDPNWTPNTTDFQHRRYRFGQQGMIAQWNLAQLANAVLVLVGETEPMQAALDGYRDVYDRAWKQMMAAKIGCAAFDATTDEALVTELLGLLSAVETDMTIFFRCLASVSSEEMAASDPGPALARLQPAYYVAEQITDAVQNRTTAWLRSYGSRLAAEGVTDRDRAARMHATNPRYVLRNYLAQLAIDAATEGDFGKVSELLEVLRRPYDEQPGHEDYAARRPDWARSRPGCSTLSCSS